MRNELGSWRRRDYGLRKKDSWLMVVDAHWQWRRSYVIIEGAGRWRRQTIGIGGCLNEDDFGFGNHLPR